MASNAHKWGRPKAGPIGPTATLSLEQQQILAAVPRYKKAWVRPASLKPGQNPNFKICKWVIDTDLDKSEGTEEEMREALEQVTAGNVPLPSTETEGATIAGGTAAIAAGGPAGPSGSTVSSALPTGAAPTPSTTTAAGTPTSGGTPAPPAPAPAPAPAAIPSSTLATSANPIAQVQGTDPAKPAEGPAPDGTAPSVQEAVKALEDVEMASMTDAGPAVDAEAKSLVQEDQVAPQP